MQGFESFNKPPKDIRQETESNPIFLAPAEIPSKDTPTFFVEQYFEMVCNEQFKPK